LTEYIIVNQPNFKSYIAAAVVIASTVYLSLYPFEWRTDLPPGGPLAAFLNPWRTWPESRGDFIANVLFYLPCGFFVIRCFARRAPAFLCLLLTMIVSMTLSGVMEFCQFYVAE